MAGRSMVQLLGGRTATIALFSGMGSVLLIVAGLMFYLARKRRLNWYEKNLLEISEQYKPRVISVRRQSTQSSQFEDSHASWLIHQRPSGGSLDSLRRKDPTKDSEIGEFTVPPLYSPTKVSLCSEPGSSIIEPELPSGRTKPVSMFRRPNKNEFNRDLYDIRQDSEMGESGQIILGPHGSLQLGMAFDIELSILRVRLLQATDIRAKRTDALPNPYFRVRLLGECTSFEGFKTKTFNETRNPMINDDFCFDVNKLSLPSCRLEVMMYDFDQFALDECIGTCSLGLNRIDLSLDNQFNFFWAEILPSPEDEQQEVQDSVGDILFRIAFLKSAHRLTVTVLKARNLQGPDDQQPPIPCVRVTLIARGRRLKSSKTAIKSATYHPTFNEALNFKVSNKFNLVELTLEMEVAHETMFAKKPIGKLVLPLSQCKEFWKSFLAEEKVSVPKWYPLEKP